MIPDDGGRPKHVGSVINKYVLMVKFVGIPYNIIGYFRTRSQCVTIPRSFCDITPSALLYRYRRFGESCCLHPQNSPTYWTTLKIEVEIFTELWLPVYQTTRHRIPDQNENSKYFDMCDVLCSVTSWPTFY